MLKAMGKFGPDAYLLASVRCYSEFPSYSTQLCDSILLTLTLRLPNNIFFYGLIFLVSFNFSLSRFSLYVEHSNMSRSLLE